MDESTLELSYEIIWESLWVQRMVFCAAILNLLWPRLFRGSNKHGFPMNTRLKQALFSNYDDSILVRSEWSTAAGDFFSIGIMFFLELHGGAIFGRGCFGVGRDEEAEEAGGEEEVQGDAAPGVPGSAAEGEREMGLRAPGADQAEEDMGGELPYAGNGGESS
nr:hypothetical protein Iba_chr15aCG1170 [Ipomoea batatas]